MGFGKRVVGPEAAARQAAKKKGKAGFGPRVIGKGLNVPDAPNPAANKTAAPKPVPATPVTVPANVPATSDSLSIEQVQAILAENPAFIETVFVQELERPEGPRREALLAIRASAEAQGLADIVTEADDLMKDQGMAPEVKADAPVEVEVEGETVQTVTIPKDFNALKALAKEHGVDLTVAKSKVDITAALVKALGEKNIAIIAAE